MQLKPNMHYLWSRDNADQALFHLHALVRTIMKIPVTCHLMFFLDRDEGMNPIISRTLGMYTQKTGVLIPTNVALRSYANYLR